jgi:altronate hydrolase
LVSEVVHIHPSDDVAVAVAALARGTELEAGGRRLTLRDDVPAGHKVALVDLPRGAEVRKYGFPIGRLTEDVAAGSWVHSHNLATALDALERYDYEGSGGTAERGAPSSEDATFLGYRRADGRVGTRNEVWVLNTVGCVNRSAERIARHYDGPHGDGLSGVDGVHAFSHPYGCSQLGDDLRHTQRVLAGLLRHPNAGGVLVLGLGCENNQLDDLLRLAGDVDRSRLGYFNSQDVGDEVERGIEAVAELARAMAGDRRTECPAADLVVGLKCGGSDGLSGVSANPLAGRLADRVTGLGGSALLTEVPEMFGAERILMERAADRRVFDDLVALIDDFKRYFAAHGQPIYENPSPGNKEGGLTTLEEKSLGAIQKGGRAPVVEVLRYGAPARARSGGLSLIEAPGNDGVSSTALVASGATLLVFTTGRGTPLGFPVPTIKVSSNAGLAARKPRWIDFDAGALATGAVAMDELERSFFAAVLEVASGRRRTCNEIEDYREIAIWKEGVTL